MPRTTTLECPGCPPLRALTFDVLGLVKVVEARSKEGGNPKVVERWGDPDSSKCVLATSFDDAESNPLLAVARKNGMIEMLNPLNGDLSFSISPIAGDETSSQDDTIAGLHLFKKQRSELSARSCSLLTCTSKGNASFRIVEADSLSSTSLKTWSVCGSGSITCCTVDASEKYSLFGGKGVEVCMWDLENSSKIWAAKPPPKNSLGIFTPTCFTSTAFLSKDDHRKIVAGTNNHQVRLYDTASQRRPVLSVDFRETPIKAIAEDADGHKIYIGNGSGDLASIDIRTGKLLGCFIGKCSGSIRSIVRHPKLPILASCGLDSYVRFWDIESRQLLSSVFLKQPLTSVVFDSSYSDDVGPETVAEDSRGEHQVKIENQTEDSEEEAPSPTPKKQKKALKKNRDKKMQQQKLEELNEDDSDNDYIEEPSPAPTKQTKSKKRPDRKKQQQQLEEVNEDDSDSDCNKETSSSPTKQKKTPNKNRDKKKRTQQLEEVSGDDSDNELNEKPAPVKRKKKAVREGGEKKLKAKKRSKRADVE